VRLDETLVNRKLLAAIQPLVDELQSLTWLRPTIALAGLALVIGTPETDIGPSNG